MRCILYAILVCAAGAQPAPVGIIRGDLVKWQATAGTGELEIKTADGNQCRCSFDRRTYFERDNQLVTADVMAAGDRLEVVADRQTGSQICYARTVHVLDPPARTSPGRRLYGGSEPGPTESFAPRGDLTFAGLVIRIDRNVLTLRTRFEGEKLILLREDTRFIGDGQRSGADGLKRNTRVFIRAGRNLDNDVEAYQVVWGDIVRAR